MPSGTGGYQPQGVNGTLLIFTSAPSSRNCLGYYNNRDRRHRNFCLEKR